MLSIQLEHVLPHLCLGVQWPLAHGVNSAVPVRERVNNVELRIVPREKRYDEDSLADCRWEDVDLQLVAHLEDVQQLRQRIRIASHLDRLHPEFVVSWEVE